LLSTSLLTGRKTKKSPLSVELSVLFIISYTQISFF
jgi:hypothetical protein